MCFATNNNCLTTKKILIKYVRSIRFRSAITRWWVLRTRHVVNHRRRTTNKERPEMTKSFRRTHDREPSARKRGATDEFEHLNLTQESRRKINDLHPKAKRKLLVRLQELINSLRQWSASFSIPSFRVAQEARIRVNAEFDPSNRSLSVNLR